MDFDNISINDKAGFLLWTNHKHVPYDQSTYKINADYIFKNVSSISGHTGDGTQEFLTCFFPLIPILRKTVSVSEADYILYMHYYADHDDYSEYALKELRTIDSLRKPGAEIIVIGTAANTQSILKDEIQNISFIEHHYVEALSLKFGVPMKENHFVYSDYANALYFFPTTGCLRKCGFCRRTFISNHFESFGTLEEIKQELDTIKKYHPDRLKRVVINGENITEYGIDIYGESKFAELLDLISSYDEVEEFAIDVGLTISEVSDKILDSLLRFRPRIDSIALHLEAGSERLLNLIGKGYDIERAIHIFKVLRKAHPDTLFCTAVIIGLPTETIGDIYSLAALLEATQPDRILCNYYTMAPRQPLAKLPQLSESAKAYHLKLFLKYFGYYMIRKREVQMMCPFVYKKPKSRKVIRNLNKMKQEFPGYGVPIEQVYITFPANSHLVNEDDKGFLDELP